jgi:hypothetical protein
MHHKPKNRRAYVDNQKCSFCEVVKMCNRPHHCVPLVEMVKKHIWNVQFGVRMRELCLQENICLGYRNFRSVLLVRDQNFRFETGTSASWWKEAQFRMKMNYWYFRSETGTFSGDQNFWWSLTGSSDWSVMNLTLRSRTDLFLDWFWDVGNLENKPWRDFLLG